MPSYDARVAKLRAFASGLGGKAPGKNATKAQKRAFAFQGVPGAYKETTRIPKTSGSWESFFGIVTPRGRRSNYKKHNRISLNLGKQDVGYRHDKVSSIFAQYISKVLGTSDIDVSQFDGDLRAIAEDAALQMINIIQAERRRATPTGGGALEKAINVEPNPRSATEYLIRIGFQVVTSYTPQMIRGGRLRGSWAVDKNDTTKWTAYGIGQKGKLPKYWKAVNFGSSHLVDRGKPVPLGHFFPGPRRPVSGLGLGKTNNPVWRFSQASGYNFTFVPKRPIPPMNYIGKTYSYIKRSPAFKNLFNKVKRAIKAAA